MKRGYQRHFYHARTIRLYRDDLEEILDVIKKHCKETVIASYEYEYDSLDELESKRGSTPKQISIKGNLPYVYFYTSRGIGGRSWVSGDGDGSEAPYLIISTLLANRKRRWLRLFFNPYTNILYSLILFLLSILYAIRLKLYIPLFISLDVLCWSYGLTGLAVACNLSW